MPTKLKPSAVSCNGTLEDHKRRIVLDYLEHYNGNRTRTAIALDINLATLKGWLREWGIPPAEPGRPRKANDLGLHVRDNR